MTHDPFGYAGPGLQAKFSVAYPPKKTLFAHRHSSAVGLRVPLLNDLFNKTDYVQWLERYVRQIKVKPEDLERFGNDVHA